MDRSASPDMTHLTITVSVSEVNSISGFILIFIANIGMNKISNIIVRSGDIIDALIVTYETSGGPIVITHGGDGGAPHSINLSGMFEIYYLLSFHLLIAMRQIPVDEVIYGVYGNVGPKQGSPKYGDTMYLSLIQYYPVYTETTVC